MRREFWTAEQIKTAKEIYPIGGATDELCLKLGKTKSAIQHKMYRNKIYFKLWNQKEINLLRRFYPKQGASPFLQNKLKATPKQLNWMASELNIPFKFRHAKGLKSKNYKGYKNISGSFWSEIQKGAIKRNLKFDLSMRYLHSLFKKQSGKCALTGVKIYLTDRIKERIKFTASLDRIDSSKGYVKENIQWVHKTINLMKQNLLEKDFIRYCKSVAEYNK